MTLQNYSSALFTKISSLKLTLIHLCVCLWFLILFYNITDLIKITIIREKRSDCAKHSVLIPKKFQISFPLRSHTDILNRTHFPWVKQTLCYIQYSASLTENKITKKHFKVKHFFKKSSSNINYFLIKHLKLKNVETEYILF